MPAEGHDMLIPEAGDGGTPATTGAPEGAAAASAAGAEGTPAAGAAPEGGAPTGAPATAATHGTEGAANAANADAALQGDPAAFDALPPAWQAEVKKLRGEAAKYRTEAKPFTDAFGAYDDGEREFLLGLTRDLGNPDTQAEAAKRMQTLAQRILEGYEPDPTQQEPLTVEKWRELQAAEQKKAQEEAAVQDVIREATDLGYKQDSPDWAMLMWLAANPQDRSKVGDLKYAHEQITGGRQYLIDTWVQEQRAKGEKWPSSTEAGGAPAEPTPGAGGWNGARSRIEARLKAVQEAGG